MELPQQLHAYDPPTQEPGKTTIDHMAVEKANCIAKRHPFAVVDFSLWRHRQLSDFIEYELIHCANER